MNDTKQIVTPGPTKGPRIFMIWLATHRRLLIQLLVLALIIGTIAYLWFGVHEKNQNTKRPVSPGDQHTAPSSADIAEYSGTSDPDGLRILVNSYVDKGDYTAAYNTSQILVAKTKAPDDYMTLLWLCTLYQVPNKDSCIDDTADKLHKLIANLSFTNAYVAGGLLEKSKRQDAAFDFYSRAYRIYDAKSADGNIMSKSDLKKHIDALRS